mgnify:CR=1 FL=1
MALKALIILLYNKIIIMNNVFISIGTNIGEKLMNIHSAINEILLNKSIKFNKISPFYLTQPLLYEKQNWFINTMLKIETNIEPFSLLIFLKEIEQKLGRKPTFKNGPRIIDLDIIFYGNKIINTKELTIPHPQFQNRLFLLMGMNSLDENFNHPLVEKKMKQLYNEIYLKQKVIKIPGWLPKMLINHNKQCKICEIIFL